MQPSRVLRNYLIDGGYGTGSKTDLTVSTNIFLNYLPTNMIDTDFYISIFDFGMDRNRIAGCELNEVTIKVSATNQFTCSDEAEEIQDYIALLPDSRIQGVTSILETMLIGDKWVSVFNVKFVKTVKSRC
jgi:hypothetical protein